MPPLPPRIRSTDQTNDGSHWHRHISLSKQWLKSSYFPVLHARCPRSLAAEQPGLAAPKAIGQARDVRFRPSSGRDGTT